MASTSYTFLDSKEEALRSARKNNFPSTTCLSDYGEYYRKGAKFFQKIRTKKKYLLELLQEIKSSFKNIQVEIIFEGEDKIKMRNAWDFEDEDDEDEEEVENNILDDADVGCFYLEISVSEEYSERARYLTLYLMAVLMRMICFSENFFREKTPETITFDYIVEINNLSKLRNHSTNWNHVFYCPGGMEKEYLFYMDNVELMNKVFENPVKEKGDGRNAYYHNNEDDIYTLDMGHWPSQTAIIKAIRKYLKEHPPEKKKYVSLAGEKEVIVPKKRGRPKKVLAE